VSVFENTISPYLTVGGDFCLLDCLVHYLIILYFELHAFFYLHLNIVFLLLFIHFILHLLSHFVK